MKKNVRLVQWLIIDSFIIMMSYLGVFILLRLLGFERALTPLGLVFLIAVPFKLGSYYVGGLYKLMVRSIGFEDLFKLSSLVFVSNVILAIILWVFNLLDRVGLVELFLITLGEWIVLGGSRSLLRLTPLLINQGSHDASKKRLMVIGAGLAGEMLVKEINKHAKANEKPVVFVDDDSLKQGKRLLGLPIVGNTDKIEALIEKYGIDEVVVAIANIPLKKLSNLLDRIASTNTPVKRVPTLQEIKSGQAYQVQPVQITDLLSREEIHLNNEAILNLIQDQVVLITGGGGSIGSELTRQIASMKPKQVIIYDIYENTAYTVQTELEHRYKKNHKKLDLKVIIGSVYNKERLESIFAEYQPTLVFHAAAYKHVPLMEESAVEALRTNVLGTHYVSELSIKYHVKKMILVSSDKAVRPTNIMGATKRLAEKIIQTAQKDSKSTAFAAVRFGNVLGSHGSVIPLFKQQIESGGPVTVTDKDVTRYFMTIPESVSLILEAASYAKEGEIFVLDMGEPVKIINLAEKMIRLAGLKPYEDIDIEFVGLREGEKKFEELILDESMKQTHNVKIFIDPSQAHLDKDWIKVLNALDTFDLGHVKRLLKELDLNYQNANH